MKKTLLSTAVAITFLFTVNAQNNVYVDVNATGANDGSSWANAYTDISTAFSNSAAETEFWVKAGVYKQSSWISYSATIIGGFDGTETTSDQANPEVNQVIFDADVNGDDTPGDFINDRGDNYPFIFRIIPPSGPLEVNISGITFKGATSSSYSALTFYNGTNDGTQKKVRVSNCTFIDNSTSGNDTGGGAVRIVSENSQSITLGYFDKCIFKGNGTVGTANVRGSVMFIYGRTSGVAGCRITNCLFDDNIDVAPYGHSCVIYQASSSNGGGTLSELFNNTFVNDGNYGRPVWYLNAASWGYTGGAFANNVVDTTYGALHIGQGAISNPYNITTFNNLWGTALVNGTTNTVVDVNNILNTNPGFVGGGDYHLMASSPCVNAGEDTLSNYLPDTLDLVGNNRFNGQIDIGAYEYQSTSVGINNIEQTTLHIYPNPTNSSLYIEVKENTNIKIVNLLGETVAEQQLHTGNNNVDVSSFSNGIYSLNTENGTSIKFIKQ